MLVKGDPSRRISDLRNTRTVMTDGKLMDADALRRSQRLLRPTQAGGGHGFQRLCHNFCAVPCGTRSVPPLAPGTPVPGFHIPPLRGWNRVALHILLHREVVTQSLSSRAVTVPLKSVIPTEAGSFASRLVLRSGGTCSGWLEIPGRCWAGLRSRVPKHRPLRPSVERF